MSIYSPSQRPRREIVEEACAWFIEFRSGDAVPSTRDRFDAWLRHSPEHIQAYLEVAATWSELPTRDPQDRIDVTTLVERARASRNDDVLVPFGSPRRSGARPDATTAPKAAVTARVLSRTLAACVVLAAIIAGGVAWLYNGVTYATGIGEQRTIRLADNSLVDLNARSTIKVRFSRNARTVELVEGQALFHVAKDAQRPFSVRSDDTTVHAVGTEFDVYRKRTGTVITVLEGRVSVVGKARNGDSNPGSERPTAVLSAGEQLTVTPVIKTLKPRLADITAATAWTQHRLVFADTPLAEVADEYNRYNPHQLIIEDPDLARRPISGVYSSTDASSLIGFLSAQPQLQVTETEYEIRVTRRP